MFRIISIILSLAFMVPTLGLAQTPVPPAVPNIDVSNLSQTISNELPAPVSNFVQKLKGMFQGGPNGGGGTGLTVGNGSSFSGGSDLWGRINNWFSSNIGISLSDIIRAVANLIIWIWELIIKLIRVGLSYL